MQKHRLEKKEYDPTASYVFGFLFSLLITIVSYLMVVNQTLSGQALIAALIVFALAQLAVQLFFFLHLGEERKPRWNLMAFAFMALVVLIVVIGSLWIMKNLDYNMHPSEVEQYIREEELIDKPHAH